MQIQPQHIENSPLLPWSSSCIWGLFPMQSSQDRHPPQLFCQITTPLLCISIIFPSLSLNADSKIWKKKDGRQLLCCLLTIVQISLCTYAGGQLKRCNIFLLQCWDLALQAFNYLYRWSQDWERVEAASILSADLSLRAFSSGILSLEIKNNPLLHFFPSALSCKTVKVLIS